jgi:hypothetical protein
VERTVATICITMLYTQVGLSHPFPRSLAVNVVSLLVGMGLDVKNRHTFMHLMNQSANKAVKYD